MRILPILFNTEMVQAVLDGTKTATRRIAKAVYPYSEHGGFTTIIRGEYTGPISAENIIKHKSQYQPGDILYVRETWHQYIKLVGKGESCRVQEFYGYKASIANSEDAHEKWKPSIHMPKEAARIFLKVTDVRIERLQDMTLDDFLNEGISIPYEAFNDPTNAYMQAKEMFMRIWDSTIRKRDIGKYGWDANPYVWVINFKRTGTPDISNK